MYILFIISHFIEKVERFRKVLIKKYLQGSLFLQVFDYLLLKTRNLLAK